MGHLVDISARKSEALSHLSKGELDDAYAIYERLASEGDTDSQVYVGSSYVTGMGRPQDASRAISWLEPAAEKGDIHGLYLALAYELNGNVEESVTALKQACNVGFAPACVRLGSMYESGVGITADIDQAMACYRMAHRSGHLFGTRFYGKCLMQGREGVLSRCWGTVLYCWTFPYGLLLALTKPDSDHFRV